LLAGSLTYRPGRPQRHLGNVLLTRDHRTPHLTGQWSSGRAPTPRAPAPSAAPLGGRGTPSRSSTVVVALAG